MLSVPVQVIDWKDSSLKWPTHATSDTAKPMTTYTYATTHRNVIYHMLYNVSPKQHPFYF